MCHEKTDLKVFVTVISKVHTSFFWYDTNVSEFDSADIIDYILKKSVSYQKKDGCSNDKDLKACFLVMRIIY